MKNRPKMRARARPKEKKEKKNREKEEKAEQLAGKIRAGSRAMGGCVSDHG